jgi:hypothetical protein
MCFISVMPAALEPFFQDPDEVGASEYRAIWECVADGCSNQSFDSDEPDEIRQHGVAMLEELRDYAIDQLRKIGKVHPEEVVAPGLPDELHALLRRLADYGRDEDIYSTQRRHFEQSEAVRKLCGLARRVVDGGSLQLAEVEAVELKPAEEKV